MMYSEEHTDAPLQLCHRHAPILGTPPAAHLCLICRMRQVFLRCLDLNGGRASFEDEPRPWAARAMAELIIEELVITFEEDGEQCFVITGSGLRAIE